MDKSAQKQQRSSNERSQRKLVRSSEHSWSGDAGVVAAYQPTSGAQQLQQHDYPVDSTTTQAEKTPKTDNKTIRRLEFFTSLQKQLMSSISRRGGSNEPAATLKRNASCRHKVDKHALVKPTMPSSYSSASLAGSGGEAPPAATIESSSSLFDRHRQVSNNLSGEMAFFKTCRLSPTLSPISNRSPIEAPSSPIPISPRVAATTTPAPDLNMSKSVPNTTLQTLTLSPTNPFFSSIEQHLIDTAAAAAEDAASKSLTSAYNPFLFDADKPTARAPNPPSSHTASCSKREEFLKATMKICLVVSPPSNKLQVSTKTMTNFIHLLHFICQTRKYLGLLCVAVEASFTLLKPPNCWITKDSFAIFDRATLTDF